MPRLAPRIALSLAAGFALVPVSQASPQGAQPLHARIDQAIAARTGGPVAGPAPDGEFLRRATLDLTGTIPTADEARRFLADPDPGKRGKLIDRLLESPDYATRMEQVFTVAWLERQKGTQVPEAGWRRYLRESFAANKPWDQLVREVIRAEGTDSATAPAARFLVDGRGAEPHRMAQDVARVFLGMNLKCAQCHDHPTVKEWKQADYYGLYAYLGGSKAQADPQSKQVALIETPVSEKSEFESVFFQGVKHATGPRLPGLAEVEIPRFEKGQEWAEPPSQGKPGVPKFRPRLLLAQGLTAADNTRFARSSVNRFWFLLMGRGLVHPLDMDHAGNPPSHPELLDTLAREFTASGFDVKRLLREIALSDAYQRSGVAPAAVDPATIVPASYRIANAKPLSAEPLSAEQLSRAVPRAAGVLEALQAAPVPKVAFALKDYVTGKVVDPPCTLTDTEELFAGIFGNPPGEPEIEFQPSMAHSLFLLNDRLILGWLKPGRGNLIDRLSTPPTVPAAAEELYLTVLSRKPDREEIAEVEAHLTGRKDRSAALAELVWALIASAEFRLNH